MNYVKLEDEWNTERQQLKEYINSATTFNTQNPSSRFEQMDHQTTRRINAKQEFKLQLELQSAKTRIDYLRELVADLTLQLKESNSQKDMLAAIFAKQTVSSFSALATESNAEIELLLHKQLSPTAPTSPPILCFTTSSTAIDINGGQFPTT
jgi:hypothetical protein